MQFVKEFYTYGLSISICGTHHIQIFEYPSSFGFPISTASYNSSVMIQW